MVEAQFKPHIVGAPCPCGQTHDHNELDPDDLYWQIDMAKVECFNQENDSAHFATVRPYSMQDRHTEEPALGTQTCYGKDMIVHLPFRGEANVIQICVVGADAGKCPTRVRLWKNEINVSIDLPKDKKCVQELQVKSGEWILVNKNKFAKTGALTLGFD